MYDFFDKTNHTAFRALGLTLLVAVAAALPASAEEWGISFSGQLLETKDGQKLPVVVDGTKTNFEAKLYIRLYDDSEGTVTDKTLALWGRRITVHTKNAMFSCELKDSAGVVLPARYESLQEAFAHLGGDKLTVGVTPFDDYRDEIAPRQCLAAVPYAVSAGDALGTVGDVEIGGTLTVGAASVTNAVFRGPVTHSDDVTFGTAPTLPELALGDAAPLSAQTLAVGSGVTVSSVAAGEMTVGDLKATVVKLGGATFSNLVVSGSAKAAELRPRANDLTIAGEAVTSHLKVSDLSLGGSINFFDWGQGANDLWQLQPGGSGKPDDKTYYTGNASSGYWTAPYELDSDVMISVSLCLVQGAEGSVSVTDGSVTTKIAELSYSGSGVDPDSTVWLPVQCFLLRGQKISWSGGTDVNVVYRVFRY